MRFRCYGCAKVVSTEVPDDVLLRAVAWCPECVLEEKDQDEDYKKDRRRLDALLDPEGRFEVRTDDRSKIAAWHGEPQTKQEPIYHTKNIHTRAEIDEVLGEHDAAPVAEPDGDPPSYLERFTRRALEEEPDDE